eukprot:CAMPEP_0197032786 /NCGR_PEP_ID=MMETSP1384-20130603/11367_1 /TAXON_ID=29189 /ORGANISM="Ammonia sp." /LENGTH=350 /DNA_ID=CAMNT_0042462491 /DNA_START=263 /DNA_END=1315 /DNA_ORIENTATION=-
MKLTTETTKPRNPRKRRFCDMEEQQDIHLNVKFTLNHSTSNKNANHSALPSLPLPPPTASAASRSKPVSETFASVNCSQRAPAAPTKCSHRETVHMKCNERKIKRFRLTFKNKTCTQPPAQKHEEIVRREASVSASSPVLHKKRAKAQRQRTHRRIEEFEVPITNRLSARNPFLCCYEFFGGYRMGICMTLGNRGDVKAALKILSQDLVSTRAKASIETAKNSFLVFIKTRKQQMIACSIVHIDHTLKRVNIDMFAVDDGWRGNGFASLMVYLIQWRMYKYDRYDLFVCAANSAVPFWSNAKYKFCMADKGILEQHEIADEKTGHTKHMIWCGSPLTARYELLQRFMQTE